MNADLPDWYPRANASDVEIDSWVTSRRPPYDEMRQALPWLDQNYQFDAWLEGVREGHAIPQIYAGLLNSFPGIAALPLPPRRRMCLGSK